MARKILLGRQLRFAELFRVENLEDIVAHNMETIDAAFGHLQDELDEHRKQISSLWTACIVLSVTSGVGGVLGLIALITILSRS